MLLVTRVLAHFFQKADRAVLRKLDFSFPTSDRQLAHDDNDTTEVMFRLTFSTFCKTVLSTAKTCNHYVKIGRILNTIVAAGSERKPTTKIFLYINKIGVALQPASTSV